MINPHLPGPVRPDEIEVMAEELAMAMGHGPVPIYIVDLEDVESASECEEEEEASEAAAARYQRRQQRHQLRRRTLWRSA